MLDSEIDFASEFRFHFYASRAVSCPRRTMMRKLKLRQSLCTDNGRKIPGGPSCDVPMKIAIISKDDWGQLYKIIL